MPTKKFTAVLHDGRTILATRANCDEEELSRLNRTVRETLGEGFAWEAVR